MAVEEVLCHRWEWYWRVNEEGEADCGIYAEPRPGRAYAVVRCPRYMKQAQWEELATHICAQHNSILDGARTITMSDVRLVAGEGKLPTSVVLDAVNCILRQRQEGSEPWTPLRSRSNSTSRTIALKGSHMNPFYVRTNEQTIGGRARKFTIYRKEMVEQVVEYAHTDDMTLAQRIAKALNQEEQSKD